MDISVYFRSIVDSDDAAIVICDSDDIIVYMNPAAAERYKKHGGYDLVGKSIMDCHNGRSAEKIARITSWFREDVSHNKIFTFHNEKENMDVYMVALRDDGGNFIGYYEKHEYRNAEDGRYRVGDLSD